MDDDIDRFLSDNNYFQDKMTSTSSSKIFPVVVQFDFGQSHQYQSLYGHLITEPIKVLKAIQFKLCFALRQNGKLPRDSFSLVVFVPLNLPTIESAIIDSNRDLYLRTGPKVNRLTKMRDFQIISMSEINSFTLATLYYCKCNKKMLYNYTIDGPLKKDVKCRGCVNPMEEIISERIVVKRRSVLMQKKANDNPRLTPMLVNFLSIGDTNYDKLRLGAHLSQIDGLSCEYENGYGSWLRGLEALSYQMSTTLLSTSHELSLVTVSDNLQTLIQTSNEISPFALALRICDLFGREVVGDGQFALKVGVIISILNQHGTESQEKSFLAIGNDAGLIRSFMQYSAKFVQRVLTYSTTIPISALPRKKDSWIDSGFLQLASDGVGIISLDKVSVRDECHIINVLTNNRVKIRNTEEKYDSIKEMETNIAIWGYETDDNIEIRVKTKSSSLITTFPLIYEAEGDLLSQKETNLTQEDWKQFFNSLHSYKPKLTSEAEEMLQSYFLAVRQDREWRADTNAFPLLLSVATVFAKLSCRSHVLTCDAALAIMVYEKSLQIKFGSGGLRLPNVAKDKNRLIGPGAVEVLERYKKLITDYIEYCGVESLDNQLEE
ncbi:uncharacterized protein LOC107359964 [Tetranychus urticae]|uniref:MCM AAA-lid domain-containing protein n=1 Tax=Tetranychus urticae TaxID=32264 RepID=T1K2W7_TETUR|nr:uncharacterized protein LOC107359964 [Tetranychus urticae]